MAHFTQPGGGQQRPFSFQVSADNPQAQFAHASGQRPMDTSATQSSQPDSQAWSGFPEQRFSYMDTPIDDNTQTFDDERQAEMLAEAHRRYGGGSSDAGQSRQQTPIQTQGLPTDSQHYPPEKQQVTRMPSAYQLSPPAEPHPAHVAPYVPPPHPAPTASLPPPPPQIVPPQNAHASPPPQGFPPPVRYTSPPPPLSPGPLPIKDEADFQKPARTSVHPPQTNSAVMSAHFAPPPSVSSPAAFSTYAGNAPDLDTQHRPGQISHPSMKASKTVSGVPQATPSNHFRYGLCACPASDLSTCMTGLFCPCIVYSRLTYRLGQRSRKQDPTDVLGFHKCNGHCFAYAALCVCGISGLLTSITRGRVRHAYNVDGDAGSDCIEGCCCCCCAIIQSEREVKIREAERTRWAGPSTTIDLDPYKRAESMRFSSAH